TRRYDVFRFTQLSLMLALPFALMVVLGGFVPSSVVVLWAFFAPLGAIAFASPREALRWFVAYLVLILAVGIFGGRLRSANNLPASLVGAMFIINITAVSLVVFANGGTIIQFAGDAIVAVWNAPVEQPRHALAAARTALAMQRAIEAIVTEDPSLPRFRVGIATGAALVGNIGSEELRNYVAHGDAVNLAARLQTGAIPGQVVVSAPTYAL